MNNSDGKGFGGKWSDKKLGALADYLAAYTTALKNQPFQTAYIDAFAGAGVRAVQTSEDADLFGGVAQEDTQYRHGSPLIALATDPPFDKFIFIDQDLASVGALRDQVKDTDAMAEGRVTFHCGDANDLLQELAAKSWAGRRAVAFLDPFALHVTWKTIESTAKTQAIDMWLLFPAMAINRMLTRSGEIPASWTRKLSETFGADDWKEYFYRKDEADLFGGESFSKTPAIFQKLSDYITMRLATVFAGVHKRPLILRNSTGAPLFLLCFASGSPTGSGIAIRIAQHIIDQQLHGH